MKIIWELNHKLIKLKLCQLAPKIYAVVVPDGYERCMLFMRAQEHYESPLNDFRGKHFCLFDFMNSYRKNFGHAQRCDYTTHWAGFNVPSKSIEDCYSILNNGHETPYDAIMVDILTEIRFRQPKGKFYVIGVDKVDSMVMSHEIAHALYYLNPKYKRDMVNAVMTHTTDSMRRDVNDCLQKMGYEPGVYVDETQAYLGTGIQDTMSRIRGIKKASKEFKKIFNTYTNELKLN